MLIAHFFDLVPIWFLLIATIALMVLFIEIGFRLGRNDQAKSRKAQTAQVRSIMGAGLGLLAFMLAFTFSTAQSHFEARVLNLAEEARIARNAFMLADLMTEPQRSQAKQLLKDYIELRSGMRKLISHAATEQLAELIQSSERIQRDLWSSVVLGDAHGGDNDLVTSNNNLFKVSVLALSDIHYTRVHSAIMNRIPFTIWVTLYLMAALAMTIMGYQAGLTGRRSPVATLTLAFAFSAVMILIIDLDRPVMSFFDINDQLLVNLYSDMEAELQLQYYPAE